MLLVLCCVLLSCKHKPPVGPGITPTGEIGPDISDEPDPTLVVTGTEGSAQIQLRYYTVNVSNNTVRSAVSMVPENTKITPELIMSYVIFELEDESLDLAINSAKVESGICTVDFNDSVYAIASNGSALEYAILDASAQSILDNVAECKSVCFTINGQAYSTANISMDIDEIYMDDDK